jgi:release factor glutamine methyltransferase
VKNFDPDLALFASDNGLAAYSRIIEQSQCVIRRDSTLVFEIGDTQSEAVSKLIEKTYPASTIQTIKDINKRDRIIFAQL